MLRLLRTAVLSRVFNSVCLLYFIKPSRSTHGDMFLREAALVQHAGSVAKKTAAALAHPLFTPCSPFLHRLHQPQRAAFGYCSIFGFHHHTQERFGAAGADQNTACIA